MSVSRRQFIAGSMGVMGGANVLPAAQREAVVRAQEPAGELHYLTIREAATRLRSKKLSPVELTQATLARIDQVEPKVRAFITLTRESALESGERLYGPSNVRRDSRGPSGGDVELAPSTPSC